MFKNRPIVKEAEKLKKEADQYYELAAKKEEEYEGKLEEAKKIALEEMFDASDINRIAKEVFMLETQEEELHEELSQKQRDALGFSYFGGIKLRRIAYSKEGEAELEKRCKELAAEYQIKFDELAKKKEEKLSEIQKIEAEKQALKEEVCEYFGCTIDADIGMFEIGCWTMGGEYKKMRIR